jgi:hypothetical protein
MSATFARLAAAGIELPPPAPVTSAYLALKRIGPLVAVSGQGTRVAGTYAFLGRLGVEHGSDAACAATRIATLNVLAQLAGALGPDLDRARALLVTTWVRIGAAPPGIALDPIARTVDALLATAFGAAGRHAGKVVGALDLYGGSLVIQEGLFRVG